MKKNFAFLVLFLFLTAFCVHAEPLNGSISHNEPLKGFYGTWHVTSKLESTNNYSLFNKLSVDIWNLSGSGNVLILENVITNAYSNITVDSTDNLDGKKLKFTRVKEYTEGQYRYRHTETPEFILDGKIFKGYDTFRIEKFDKENRLISTDEVKYKVVGQKIAGD